MDVNPHALHQILHRIREQMRCPQCGTQMPVDFPSVKIAANDFMLLQLKCESCAAFIVLHVNLVDQKMADDMPEDNKNAMLNTSSTLSLTEEELSTLRSALDTFDGSFEKLFAATEGGVGTDSVQM